MCSLSRCVGVTLFINPDFKKPCTCDVHITTLLLIYTQHNDQSHPYSAVYLGSYPSELILTQKYISSVQ